MGGHCIRTLVVGAIALLSAVVATPVQAAFPGQNGKIALIRSAPTSHWDVFSISPTGAGDVNLTSTTDWSELGPVWSPDGTEIAFERSGSVIGVSRGHDVMVMDAAGGSQTNVTNTAGTAEIAPAWSPDGSRIAFTEFGPGGPYLSTMNRDGSNRVQLTTMDNFQYSALTDPSGKNWSPDGTKIAFRDPDGFISVINTDGTGQTRLTSVMGSHPSWSPDGTRIAFAAYFAGDPPSSHPDEIYTMNADGSEPTRLTENTVLDHSPAWSPDGTRIAFTSVRTGSVQIHTMNPDGSDVQQVTTASSLNSDWQSLPVNSYPRPKGATPFQVSLVPAYKPCVAPNRTHGPPLAFPACNPPAQQVSSLTVGTADANGKPSKSVSFMRFDALAGNPATAADEADVQVTASVTDVYAQPALGDYVGDVQGRIALRVTDKLNTPHPGGPGPGTMDVSILFPIACAATTDTTVGATCGVATTVDALSPGAVPEGRRSIWELGQVTVEEYDGPPFMRQGVFVP